MSRCPPEPALLDYAAERSQGEARTEVERHLSDCTGCASIVSDARERERVAAQSPTLLASGRRLSEPSGEEITDRRAPAQLSGALVDRYRILAALGEGGMGVVYLAHDPQLDRRVALKLVRPERASDDDGQLRARMLREAQAMARLSHPAVVRVYDAGPFGDQLFVAMELIEGGRTLADWLREKPRSWREVLDLFLQAGRGLQAAHAAGIVHRDFKPQNVLVGASGEARVTDFGLARLVDRQELPPSAEREVAPGAAPLITRAGGIIGTPGYMAPEQIRGAVTDARADQFSFCVALWEALYGARPFAGATLFEQSREIAQRRVRPAPEGTRVPRRLRRVLLRGLSPAPGARFPSIDALLAALAEDPAVRWRKLGAGLGLLALVGGAALVARWQGAAAPICGGAELKLGGVWDAPLRAQGERAFAATQLSYAPSTWALAQKALDRYALAWTAMRKEACEATALRHEQSAELLDLRIACLDDRLRALGATSALFSTADKEVVAGAINAASNLPPLEECANERALRAPGAPAPAQRPAVDALRAKLAQANALIEAGKAPVAMAREVREQAKQLGYAPLEAEALYALGRAEQLSGDDKAALETLVAAAAAALGAKTDALLADAWVSVLDINLEQSKLDAADAAALQARAAVSRLGEPPLARGALLMALTELERQEGKLDDAVRDEEQAVALLEKSPEKPRLLVMALDGYSALLATRAQWPEALKVQRRALAIAVENYGPDSPASGRAEQQLGEMLNGRDHDGEARAHLEHALAVLEAAFGPDNPRLSDVLDFLADNSIDKEPARAVAYLERALRVEGAERGAENISIAHSYWLLGIARMQQRQLEAARAPLEKAREIGLRLSRDPDDLDVALVAATLGEALIDLGDFAAARPLLEAARASEEKVYGPDHPSMGDAELQLARIAFFDKRLPEARRLCARSLELALRDRDLGGSNPDDRQVLLAEILLAAGEGEEARAPLEQLVARPAASISTSMRARAHGLLARVLWPHEAERPRARQLAALAREQYAALGGRLYPEEASLSRWLDAHRGAR